MIQYNTKKGKAYHCIERLCSSIWSVNGLRKREARPAQEARIRQTAGSANNSQAESTAEKDPGKDDSSAAEAYTANIYSKPIF